MAVRRYHKAKPWSRVEENYLIRHYPDLTIKELELRFPERSRESIYAKIKRLKETRKLKTGKKLETIRRATKQRGQTVKSIDKKFLAAARKRKSTYDIKRKPRTKKGGS